MNDLVTRQQNQLGQSSLAHLPRWLGYLVAAYPSARLLPETFLVYENEFQDADPDLLMEIATRVVKASKWFPTVHELRALVEASAYELPVHAEPATAGFYRQILVNRWQVCDTCEELSPTPGVGCPFCGDLQEGASL